MAITIDGKEYDEATLDNNVKNSIVQVQNSNQQIAQLQAEVLNHQIIAQHHSKFIKDNLPVDDEAEAPVEAADVGSDDESAETDSE